jgi:hypothetical protein
VQLCQQYQLPYLPWPLNMVVSPKVAKASKNSVGVANVFAKNATNVHKL